MTRRPAEAVKPTGPLIPLLLVALAAFVVIAIVRSALEAPSGEGVPGPADWHRDRQATEQAGP